MKLLNQNVTEFGPLQRNIAGAVFLSTPHSRSVDPKSWQNANTILRLHSRSKSLRLPMTVETAERLSGISREFEKGFQLIPVLSAYETRETRVGSFLSAKIIVSRGTIYSTYSI